MIKGVVVQTVCLLHLKKLLQFSFGRFAGFYIHHTFSKKKRSVGVPDCCSLHKIIMNAFKEVGLEPGSCGIGIPDFERRETLNRKGCFCNFGHFRERGIGFSPEWRSSGI